MKKLYVGCGLTGAPEKFKSDVELLKLELRKDWQVLRFLGVIDGTPKDVYERDIIENVGGCDAFLSIWDERSSGLGWEANEALHLGKPTLGVAHEESSVARLVQGAPYFNPNFTFIRYKDMVRDVPGMVATHFAVLLNPPTS